MLIKKGKGIVMALGDNSYQVTGKVCPPSLPMSVLTSSDQWPGLTPPAVELQSLFQESPAQEVARASLPENLCALISQAQVLLKTDEGSPLSSVVSLPYYFCNFCNHHTDSRALLLQHLAEKHIFQCSICEFMAFSRCSLVQHQFRSHIDAEEVNPILSTRFAQVNLAQLHRTLWGGGEPSSRNAERLLARPVDQVSSASSHRDNFLLLPGSQSHDVDNQDSITTTQDRDSLLLPSRDSCSTQAPQAAEPMPHFLDVRNSIVSSSIISSVTESLENQNTPCAAGSDIAPSSSSSVPDTSSSPCVTTTASYSEHNTEGVEDGPSRRRSTSRSSIPVHTSRLLGGNLERQVENVLKRSDFLRSTSQDKRSAPAQRLYNTEAESSNAASTTHHTGSSGKCGQVRKMVSKNVDNFLLEAKERCEDSGNKDDLSTAALNSQEVQQRGQASGAFFRREDGSKSYDILRGLLVGEASLKIAAATTSTTGKGPTERIQSSHHNLPSSSTTGEAASSKPPTTAASLHKNSQPKRASDMSLKELLTQPSLSQTSGKENKDQGPHIPLPPSVVLVCGYCNLECTSKSELLMHVERCPHRNKHHRGNFDTQKSSASHTVPTLVEGMLHAVPQKTSRSNIALPETVREMLQAKSHQRAGPPDRSTLSHASEDASSQQHAKEMEFGVSGPLYKLRPKQNLSYTSLSDEDGNDYDDDDENCREWTPRRKRHRDEEDADYFDEGASISDDSDAYSSDSVDEAKLQRRYKKAKVGVLAKGKFGCVEDILVCLHCSSTIDGQQSMRKHLRGYHPFSVPFATASLRTGKKTLVYFCQNFKCSFASSKGTEIISHIKLCYMGSLDKFSNSQDPESDFSSVLSSMGIASKLVDSSPSTFYCLRCNYSKHSFQPIAGHVLGSHTEAAGVLRVMLGEGQPKHTRVHMVCLVCTASVDVALWKSHPCRIYGKKIMKDLSGLSHSCNTDATASAEAVQSTNFVNNCTKEQLNQRANANTETKGILSGLGKSSSPFKLATPGSGHTSAATLEQGDSNDGSVIEITDDEKPEENSLIENLECVATSSSSNQAQENKTICVISNSFTVKSDFGKPSSTRITESLLATPTNMTNSVKLSKSTKSLLGNPGNISRSPLTSCSTVPSNTITHARSEAPASHSVLHGLLVQAPQDLSSTKALTLLQNLLTGTNAAGVQGSSNSKQTQPAESSSCKQTSLLPPPKPSSDSGQKMPWPSRHSSSSHLLPISPQREDSDHKQIPAFKFKLLDHPNDDKYSKPCDISSILKSELTSAVTEDSSYSPATRSVFSSQSAAHIVSNPHQSRLSPLSVTTHVDPHRGSGSMSNPQPSPPATIPTPPQLPAHLRPLSPSPPPPPIVGVSRQEISSSSAIIASSPELSQQRGRLSLFPTSSSEPLQSSPFTNLLRGLLSMSQKKDKEGE